MEDRPTIAERYARATRSSHLEVNELRTGDVDVLIAAGWVGDTLGTLLYRLVSEYDSAKGEKALYEAEVGRLQLLHKKHVEQRDREQKAMAHGPTRYAVLRAEVERLSQEIAREMVTGRAMVLMNLRSLAPAKQALGRFALLHAQVCKYQIKDADVLALAGRVLDVYLDPNCGHCNGRGFTGGSHRGEKQVICRPCKGSGKRRDAIGRNTDERQFAGSLLFEMSDKTARVERSMRNFLRTRVADA
jgi:hypothetical protein